MLLVDILYFRWFGMRRMDDGLGGDDHDINGGWMGLNDGRGTVGRVMY